MISRKRGFLARASSLKTASVTCSWFSMIMAALSTSRQFGPAILARAPPARRARQRCHAWRSQQPKFAQLAPHVLGHVTRARCSAVEIAWRIFGVEVAPALKGTKRTRLDWNDLGPQHQPAAADTLFVDERADRNEALPAHDLAADHPVKRTAVEQLVNALGHHPRRMDVLWLFIARFLLFETLLDPT